MKLQKNIMIVKESVHHPLSHFNASETWSDGVNQRHRSNFMRQILNQRLTLVKDHIYFAHYILVATVYRNQILSHFNLNKFIFVWNPHNKAHQLYVLRTNFIEFPRSFKIRSFTPFLSSCGSILDDGNSCIAFYS